MGMKVEFANTSVDDEYMKEERGRAAGAYKELQSGNINMTGWATLPDEITDEKFDAINAAADRIKAASDYLIVVGIGGSFLGACSVIDIGIIAEGVDLFIFCNLSKLFISCIYKNIKSVDKRIHELVLIGHKAFFLVDIENL